MLAVCSLGWSWPAAAPAALYTWNGSANSFWDTTSTNWSGAGSTWVNGNEALLGGAGGSTITINTPGITANSLAFHVSGYTIAGTVSNNLTLTGAASVTVGSGLSETISAPIAGSAGLTKPGLGALALTGANPFTGGVTINRGLVQISSDGAGATNPLGAYPGSFQAGNITLNGGGGLAATATGIGAGGSPSPTLAVNRGITLGDGLETLVKGWRASFTVNGVISGSGGLFLKDNAEYGNGGTGGGGRYRFNAANTYTGDTILFDLGTQDPGLVIGNANALQNSTIDHLATLIPFGNAGRHLWAQNNNMIGGLKGNKNLNLNFQSGVVTNANIGNNNQNTIYTGILQQSSKVGITKIGTGTLQLGGVNTMTGGVTVSNGTLIATATGSALGTQATAGTNGLSVANNATFAFLPVSAGPLTLGQGQLALVGGSTVGTAIGGSASQSAITSTVAASTSGPLHSIYQEFLESQLRPVPITW